MGFLGRFLLLRECSLVYPILEPRFVLRDHVTLGDVPCERFSRVTLRFARDPDALFGVACGSVEPLELQPDSDLPRLGACEIRDTKLPASKPRGFFVSYARGLLANVLSIGIDARLCCIRRRAGLDSNAELGRRGINLAFSMLEERLERVLRARHQATKRGLEF